VEEFTDGIVIPVFKEHWAVRQIQTITSQYTTRDAPIEFDLPIPILADSDFISSNHFTAHTQIVIFYLFFDRTC